MNLTCQIYREFDYCYILKKIYVKTSWMMMLSMLRLWAFWSFWFIITWGTHVLHSCEYHFLMIHNNNIKMISACSCLICSRVKPSSFEFLFSHSLNIFLCSDELVLEIECEFWFRFEFLLELSEGLALMFWVYSEFLEFFSHWAKVWFKVKWCFFFNQHWKAQLTECESDALSWQAKSFVPEFKFDSLLLNFKDWFWLLFKLKFNQFWRESLDFSFQVPDFLGAAEGEEL